MDEAQIRERFEVAYNKEKRKSLMLSLGSIITSCVFIPIGVLSIYHRSVVGGVVFLVFLAIACSFFALSLRIRKNARNDFENLTYETISGVLQEKKTVIMGRRSEYYYVINGQEYEVDYQNSLACEEGDLLEIAIGKRSRCILYIEKRPA